MSDILTRPAGGVPGSAPPSPAAASAPGPNDLSLLVNGIAWSGWQEVRVTRGAERCPSDFDIAITERFPDQDSEISVKPGDTCVVMIGKDPVITGFIDRYGASLSANGHSVRIMGRSKTQDLVDCSAKLPGMQISAASLSSLAQQVAKDFGIAVRSLSGPGPVIPVYNIILTETPFEIIERAARYSAMLAYDGTDGSLILSQVGASKMASGFEQGINVQRASATFSIDERFSEYIAVMMSVDKASDIGEGGNLVAVIPDPGFPAGRYRPKIIVSEQSINGTSLAELRARWEMARRYGRSQAVTITTDAWRDSAGLLWAPNAIAHVNLPSLKIVNVDWVISSVSFIKSADRGTVADLVLMPQEAFQPAPELLQTFAWQIDREIQRDVR